jgi:hypothetical protein
MRILAMTFARRPSNSAAPEIRMRTGSAFRRTRLPLASIAGIAISVWLAVLPAVAVAACDKDPECGDPTAWSGFDRVVLKQSSPGSLGVLEWRASFDHAAIDASIDTEMRGSGGAMKGTVALLGGQIMMSKGLKLEPGYEIDALDAPVLSMKLLMIVLGRVFPKGPAEISGPRRIDRTDKIGIKYATSSASGYIPAPWRVKGKVTRLPSGNVTFGLALTFPIEQKGKRSKTVTMNMAGELGIRGRPVFLDADLLEGWTTYGLGPREVKEAGRTILDYGATPDQGTRYKTIGDVRAFIAAENHPGYKDATKDFTGFWKEKCEQAYGLQIMHQGSEGKYSIVFCGPGGCGKPSEVRPTFITGDKRWEVVSEDELIEIGRSGDRETYRRCTKETNPILEYK